jgi:hypothetical protein
MIRHLTEIGLGVRSCPADRVEWYFEPCLRLASLHDAFRRRPEPALGAAAEVLAVGESLVSVQARSYGRRKALIDLAQKLKAARVTLRLDEKDRRTAVGLVLGKRFEAHERTPTYLCDGRTVKSLATRLRG